MKMRSKFLKMMAIMGTVSPLEEKEKEKEDTSSPKILKEEKGKDLENGST